jgi:ABC-type sugar transport system ATPase subunit
VTRLGFIIRKEAARRANDFVKLLAIRTSSLDQPVINLSGGNQQKTVLARWLAIHPKVLLLDDPTAGIDAGAKHEIYKILADLTAAGVIVILVSSELPELLGMCDRLAVLCAGRLATVLERSNFNEELVMAYAAGIRSD